jgi:hypothetical protein
MIYYLIYLFILITLIIAYITMIYINYEFIYAKNIFVNIDLKDWNR